MEKETKDLEQASKEAASKVNEAARNLIDCMYEAELKKIEFLAKVLNKLEGGK